jgi:hypothetical protein
MLLVSCDGLSRPLPSICGPLLDDKVAATGATEDVLDGAAPPYTNDGDFATPHRRLFQTDRCDYNVLHPSARHLHRVKVFVSLNLRDAGVY